MGVAPERVAYGRLLWVGPLAGMAAAAVNVLVYFGASALGAIPEGFVVSGRTPVTLVPVVISSFVPAVLGAGLLALLGRFAGRPVRTFRIIAGVAVLSSFATPITLPGAPVAMMAALILMHVVAAVVIVGVLTTLGRKG